MQLAAWNPFREIDDLLHRYQQSGLMSASGNGGLEWSPVVDIKETKKEYLIEAELPGVNKDDVNITINNGILTLKGERHSEKEDKDKKHHRVERFYGHFIRSFTLPEDVAVDKISADSKDGVILLHLPKTKVAAPKAIEIKVH